MKKATAALCLLLSTFVLSNTAFAEEADQKTETVYVIADASGTPEKTFVSDESKELTEGDEGTVQELPVSVTVSYFLDGTEMTPEEIAGKSGQVTIRFSYENTAVSSVTVGGKEYDLHAPFAALTVCLLDQERLSDIEITNGKLLSDEDHLAVLGVAFPGLNEDLSKECYASVAGLAKTEIPDYVEITATAEDFQTSTCYTVVTADLLANAEEKLTGVVGDVFGKLNALEGGISQITGGIEELKNGADDLSSGAGSLSDGLKELSEKSAPLTEGAEQIFQSMLDDAKNRLTEAGVKVDELTADNYGDVLEKVSSAAPEEMASQIAAVREKLDAYQQFYEGLTAYTQGVDSARQGADEIKSGADSIQGGALTLQLVSGILEGALPDLGSAEESLRASVSLAAPARYIWKIRGI